MTADTCRLCRETEGIARYEVRRWPNNRVEVWLCPRHAAPIERILEGKPVKSRQHIPEPVDPETLPDHVRKDLGL